MKEITIFRCDACATFSGRDWPCELIITGTFGKLPFKCPLDAPREVSWRRVTLGGESELV